ncbi:hypothetical protein B484DRAFT_212513 [Ochromonadaceae sp. CCMP2298]|nr:hypothetical protein B484DRAFT_212513 [Ochromonadaceae sp. CCMP2298]
MKRKNKQIDDIVAQMIRANAAAEAEAGSDSGGSDISDGSSSGAPAKSTDKAKSQTKSQPSSQAKGKAKSQSQGKETSQDKGRGTKDKEDKNKGTKDKVGSKAKKEWSGAECLARFREWVRSPKGLLRMRGLGAERMLGERGGGGSGVGSSGGGKDVGSGGGSGGYSVPPVVHIRNILPPTVARGALLLLSSLSPDQWDHSDAGSDGQGKKGYGAGSTHHSFCATAAGSDGAVANTYAHVAATTDATATAAATATTTATAAATATTTTTSKGNMGTSDQGDMGTSDQGNMETDPGEDLRLLYRLLGALLPLPYYALQVILIATVAI